MIKRLIMLITIFLPWCLKRPFLNLFFGFDLHPSSYVGLSWILPDKLLMGPNSRIGHLSVCKGIALLHLKENARIGNLNWITGFPIGAPRHFAHETDRQPELIVEEHAAITNRHLIDCTNSITIGSFTIVAGFQSQFITHSIDLIENRQSSKPISIGKYCFVGSNSVLLGGSSLPDYSVMGANSLLNKSFTDTYQLYAGVPARAVKALPKDYKYFERNVGFVD